MPSFIEARLRVIEMAGRLAQRPGVETLDLADICGRVLAEPILTDRNYPPFHRATRDGFAVRAADAMAGARLRCIGEISAGRGTEKIVNEGECVQIMTGAPVPRGADAVVMIEHVHAAGDEILVERMAAAGQNIVQSGSEAIAGQRVLERGIRMGYAEMAVAAQVGHTRVNVFAKPRIAVLSTGNEVIDIAAAPGPFEIRNSNGLALETLVRLAGGEPQQLGNAADDKEALRERIERGLEADMLVISGGVSMGKYDLVEGVLADLGAEIFFDSVAMRPGKPMVFGRCRGKLFFGLPGNPVSSMVTFQVFVSPAIDLLGGAMPRALPMVRARLAHAVHEKGELTHLVPARVTYSSDGPEVTSLGWQGSGDTVAIARANAFLVVPAEKLEWAAGEWAMVLPRVSAGGSFS